MKYYSVLLIYVGKCFVLICDYTFYYLNAVQKSLETY